MTSLRVSALWRSLAISSSVIGMLTLPRTPSWPIMLTVLRQTSLMPYSPGIMGETGIVVAMPLRMHLQMWQTDIDTA